MNDVLSEFAKLVGRSFAEKWDKDISESEVNMTKKNEYPKVVVKHIRVADGFGVMSKGGATLVQLEIRKGVCYSGIAFCWKGDVYNKIKGKSIAFGRLMQAVKRQNYLEDSQTYDFILSKIGKIDRGLFGDAYIGRKIK